MSGVWAYIAINATYSTGRLFYMTPQPASKQPSLTAPSLHGRGWHVVGSDRPNPPQSESIAPYRPCMAGTGLWSGLIGCSYRMVSALNRIAMQIPPGIVVALAINDVQNYYSTISFF